MFRKNGDNNFIYAATAGYLEVVQKSVARGVDIEAGNGEALRGATTNGHLEVVKFLVGRGADISINQYAALRAASTNLDFEMVKFFVAQKLPQVGLDIALVEAHNATQLTGREEGKEIIKYLLAEGAYIHAEGDYLLKDAVFKNNFPLVQLYVEAGADIHASNEYAVCWAAYNGNLEMVKYLVGRGADMHARRDFPLQWAHKNDHKAVVDYIIEEGQWEAEDENGQTLLGRLCEDSQNEIALFLAQKIENFKFEEEMRLKAEAEAEKQRAEDMRRAELARHNQVVAVLRERPMTFKIKKRAP